MADDKLPTLLPCPFCGKAPRLMDWGGTEWWVRCDCGCVRSTSSRRADAIERWNTRAISSPGLEALRWILPMAKGFAHEHPVGRNMEIVRHAEEIAALAPAAGTRGDAQNPYWYCKPCRTLHPLLEGCSRITGQREPGGRR